VREHSHTPNREILFCFEGKGTVLVDGVPHPFVPGTTVYAGPGVRHKIINDGPGELKMTWTYLPPGLDEFFAAIGRPRRPRRAGASAVRAPRRCSCDRGEDRLRPTDRRLIRGSRASRRGAGRQGFGSVAFPGLMVR
jgi:Cupin domain